MGLVMSLRRIISFDGGGIRGMFALQVAARIESLFREEHGRSDLVLADVVDLFAGTSTGAIIATCLAWGMSAREIEEMYFEHGRAMFAREWFWMRWKCKYRAESIAQTFRELFKEDDGTPATLGSSKLRKLLLVVMRNASTGSPWPVSSNPNAKYNRREHPGCNLNIPIWQLLRASTAAPTFFPPEQINLGQKQFLFVDGGVTPFNNPALLSVMMATLPCYNLNWPAHREALHLTSIGTGAQKSHLPKKAPGKINLYDQGKWLINALLGAVADNQDAICRVVGDCCYGAKLDAELGCLDEPSLLPPPQQKFSYARYNCFLDSEEIGTPLTPIELRLDNLKMLSKFKEIGEAYAKAHVRREHLYPREAPSIAPATVAPATMG
jgi:hypothetical protein